MLTEKDYSQNVGQLDKLCGYKSYIHNYLRFFFRYKKRYKNYIWVINHVRKGRYPIKAELKKGGTRVFRRYEDVYADLMNLDYDIEDDIVYVNGMEFHGGKTDGDLVNVFSNNEYRRLSVAGKVVVDIGASIGDSSIYFAKRGARKVIAFEPNQQTYNLARRNIKLNGFSNIIELINAGTSSASGDEGQVPMLTLRIIIEKYAHNPDILKIDCEGCEYEIILNSSCETIAQFSQIQIEYHHGYRNLKDKLTRCGFSVHSDKPTYFRPFNKVSNVSCCYSSSRISNQIDKLFIGMIFAERKGNQYCSFES